MHNASIDKAECGSTTPLEDPAPKKLSSFRWKTILLSVSITIICILGLSRHISISPAQIISDISDRAEAKELMDVFQPHKPVRVSPDSVVGDGCKEEVLLMKHRFGSSYGHPYVGKLP